MPYIGNRADSNFSSIDMQTLTGNGGTSYTLNKSVANQFEIEVYVNNVRQEPGVAYTANGTALNMTGNVIASDGFYVIYQGKAVQTTKPPAGSVGAAELAPGTIPTAINTAASDPTKTTNATLGSVYVNSSTGEMYVCTDATTNNNVFMNVGSGRGNINTPTFESYYLVIGGGGAGGSDSGGGAGGGGAGGYRSSWPNEMSGGGSFAENNLVFTRGTTYTITVGAGGTIGSIHQVGNAGGDSSITGSNITNVVSNGGAGGAGQASSSQSGGGSGGGGGGNSGGAPSSGTANQGFGGGALGGSGMTGGGGGGGASSAGTDPSGNTGGNGGSGLTSTITGSAVSRAGGGGGGSDSRAGGSAGTASDGGGAGGRGANGVNGTANTGAGGGGAGYGSAQTRYGGTGGSGVVILRMHESGYAGASVTGSPTVTSVGSDKVLVYTQSGTFAPA